jgi:hypothetical protein
MDLHQRQQFDVLLQTATERFVARIEERHRGAERALEALRADPTATTAALATFVAAIFHDFLLDDADGAAFVLRAVPRRSIAAHRAALADTATVEDLLAALARGLFAELLLTKALESLEQRAGYEAVQPVPP